MKQDTPEYREWLLRRNRKLLINRTKKKQIIHEVNQSNKTNRRYAEATPRIPHNLRVPKIRIEAPPIFSFFNNPEGTVSFFKNIDEIIIRGDRSKELFFNLEKIVDIGIDALMYLLSIIKNFKTNKLHQCKFSGNFPNDPIVRQVFDNSGFLNYFETNEIKIKPNDDYYTIQVGNDYDQMAIAKLCDFVNNHYGTPTKYTNSLFSILSEFMLNTTEHAYRTINYRFINYWYLFAQTEPNILKLTFHDNGEGIPATIAKKLLEILKDKLVPSIDSKYLLSAFSGEFRSQTQQPNRGRGLPDIYNHLKNGNIKVLKVISGKAYCIFDRTDINNSQIIELDSRIKGTLYYIEIEREEDEHELD